MDRAGNPPPNVLLMLAMALAAWGLVYMAATSVWSWHTELSNTTIESVHSPQIATIADKPKAKPMRKRAKVNRRRPGAHRLRHGFCDRRFEPPRCLSPAPCLG